MDRGPTMLTSDVPLPKDDQMAMQGKQITAGQLMQSWSTLLVGYPKWKIDVDNGKFPLVKILRLSIEPVGLNDRYDRCPSA